MSRGKVPLPENDVHVFKFPESYVSVRLSGEHRSLVSDSFDPLRLKKLKNTKQVGCEGKATHGIRATGFLEQVVCRGRHGLWRELCEMPGQQRRDGVFLGFV